MGQIYFAVSWVHLTPTCHHSCCLASSPGPTPQKGCGHTCKHPLLAVSAVFVIDQSCSSITNYYIHDHMKLVVFVLRQLEDGNEATRLFAGLEFQKLGTHLHLICSYSLLPGLASTGAPEPVPQVPRPRDQCWEQNL